MNYSVRHNDYSISIFIVLCGIGILLFCFIAGCVDDSSSSTNVGNLTNVPANDVIIPVASPSSMTYTSNMQKGGIPSSSLIYEGLVIKDIDGKFDPALAQSGTFLMTQRLGHSILSKMQHGMMVPPLPAPMSSLPMIT